MHQKLIFIGKISLVWFVRGRSVTKFYYNLLRNGWDIALNKMLQTCRSLLFRNLVMEIPWSRSELGQIFSFLEFFFHPPCLHLQRPHNRKTLCWCYISQWWWNTNKGSQNSSKCLQSSTKGTLVWKSPVSTIAIS